MARPRENFDWHLVDSLATLEASEAFIAERLITKDGQEVNAKTVQAKIKLLQRRIRERFNCSFVQFREQKLEDKKISLRQWQWKAAEAGNVTAQIWLGKQYLGQSDKTHQQISGVNGGPIETVSKSQETVDRLLLLEKDAAPK